MRIALCLSFLLVTSFAFAQDLVLTPIAENFCKPGVIGKSPSKGLSFDYSILPNQKLKFGDGVGLQNSFNSRMSFKLKIPVIHRPDFTFLVGFAHYREEYHVQDIKGAGTTIFSDLHDRNLKSSRLSMYMIKPITSKLYLALKGDVAFNGDYNGLIKFDDRYMKYNVATIFGYKPKPNVELGVGMLFRSSFIPSSFPVLPFFVYNQTFSDKWGIESVLPVKIKVRYNINEKSHLLFGPEYVSRSYSIDNVNNNTSPYEEFYMKRSELRFGVAFERQLSDWVWFNVETGYSHNFSTQFNAVDSKGVIQKATAVMPSDGMFFKIGIFVSPPKSRCK